MVKGPLSGAMAGRSRWQIVESAWETFGRLSAGSGDPRTMLGDLRAALGDSCTELRCYFWHVAQFQYSQKGRGARGFLNIGNWLLREQLPEVVCCSHVECLLRLWKTCGMLFFDPKVKIGRNERTVLGTVRIYAQSSS
jgi:hypothetical protein